MVEGGMTETELAAVLRGIAPVVRELVTQAAAESAARAVVLEHRTKELEGRLADLVSLRDRVVVVETKAALPLAPALPVDPIYQRLAALEAKALVVGPQGPPGPSGVDGKDGAAGVKGEAGPAGERGADGSPGPSGRDGRDGLPGIPGEKGLNGLDGKDGGPGRDGLNGKDGTAGLSFEGVYQEGKSYEFGHLVTWAGSSWHCNEPTTTKPGDGSKAWTLMVKRGRDGRDGNDAPGALPVVSVGRR